MRQRAKLLALTCWVIASCSDPAAYRERALAEAAAASAAGARPRAIEILAAAIQYDPADAALALPLAEAHVAENQPWAALDAIRQLSAADRNTPATRRIEGSALLAQGAVLAAARLLATPEVAEVLPVATRQRLLRGLAAKQALEPSDLALPAAWVPDFCHDLIAEGRRTAAVAWLRLLPESPQRAELEEKLVESWLAAGDPPAEAAAIREWVASPRSGTQWLGLRALQLAAGDNLGASAAEQRFLAEFPQHVRRAEILLASARRARAEGDAAGALALVREAAALEPAAAEPARILALSLKDLGRRDEARAALRIAAELAPSDAVVADALAELSGQATKREARAPHIELDLEVRTKERE